MSIKEESYAIDVTVRFTKATGLANSGGHLVADMNGVRLFVDTIQGKTCVITAEYEGDTYYVRQYDTSLLLHSIAKAAQAIKQEIQNG